MEPYRSVLRRKKHVLSTLLNVDDAILDSCVKCNLLSPTEASAIKNETTNTEKVSKLVEQAAVSDHATFTQFCDVVGTKNQWLQEDLLAEIKAELGSLQIEGYIQTEAAMMVHRRFGRSRRISEMDKRHMASLIATKVQSTKEACRRQLTQAQQNLEQLEQAYKNMQTQVGNLSTKLRQFIRHHDVVLYDPMLDLRSTTQALLNLSMEDDKEALHELEEQLDFLLARFNRLLAERTSMVKDRQKLGNVLNLKLNGPLNESLVDKLKKIREENENMVKYLRQKVINLEDKVNKSEATVGDKEKLIAKLRSDMEGLENELLTFKKNIDTMHIQSSSMTSINEESRRKSSHSSRTSSTTSLEKRISGLSMSSSSCDSLLSATIKLKPGRDDIEKLNLPPINPGTPMSSPGQTRKRFHRCSSDRN